jgi:hypothetical protein
MNPLQNRLSGNPAEQKLMTPGDKTLSVRSDQLSAGTKTPGQMAEQMAGQGAGATQPMSGSLPPGQTPPGQPGWNTAIRLNKTPQKLEPALPATLATGLPDLTVAAQPTVNRIKTRWNATVALTATAGSIKAPMSFTVQNNGKAPAKACQLVLTVSGKEVLKRALGPLAPGETVAVDASLDLTPGIHPLVLVVDHANTVPESNEGNNRFQMNLNVMEKSAGNLIIPVRPESKINPIRPMR